MGLRSYLQRRDTPAEGSTSQVQASDADLLRQVAAGEQNAMDRLYSRYATLVFSVAVRIVKNEQAAEDILQEVFLQLWRRPESFDEGRGSLPAWLAVMSRNRSIDILRRVRPGAEPGAQDLAAPQNVESQAMHSEMCDKVRSVLASMKQDQRSAIEMAVFEGLTHQEIASRTGTPLGTVKTRIRTGFQAIREALR